MYQEILALFSSNGAIAAAIGVLVALIIKSISMLNQIIEFHDKHFIEKRYKRLADLASSIHVSSRLKRYLDDSFEREVFRIVSGVNGSSLQIAALVRLDSLGYWNREQIRKVARFLIVKPECPSPYIEITKADKFGARFGLAVAVLLLLAGGAISIVLTVKVPLFGFFIGLIPLTVMIWAGGYFAADHGVYKNALSIQKYLINHPDTFSTNHAGDDVPSSESATDKVNLTS